MCAVCCRGRSERRCCWLQPNTKDTRPHPRIPHPYKHTRKSTVRMTCPEYIMATTGEGLLSCECRCRQGRVAAAHMLYETFGGEEVVWHCYMPCLWLMCS